jgi:hypothetical protein
MVLTVTLLASKSGNNMPARRAKACRDGFGTPLAAAQWSYCQPYASPYSFPAQVDAATALK